MTSTEKPFSGKASKTLHQAVSLRKAHQLFALDFKGGYKYQENCYEIFEKFFLEFNPFFNIIDTEGQKLKGSFFGNAFGGINAPPLAPLGPVMVVVPCTIQEFYNGCVKNIEYQR